MRDMPGCDYQPPIYEGPSREEVLATRQQYCNPTVFTYYKEPLMIVDGHMQYLYDETGRRYLDLFAGIVTVSCGHCHPKILARTQAQLAKLQHATTIYLHPGMGELAKRLANKMPGDLDVTYFVNSGSEANDLAITMARLYTGNYDVIALQNAYHGGSPSAMGLTSHHTWKFPLPQGQGVHHVKNPDPYRNTNARPRDVEDAIRLGTSGQVAAFIAEPIQGVGGVTSGEPAYFQGVYETTRQYGGVCIADEVQTGFGRTGDHFWGFQNFDVMPDIVTMAKGLGNGIPIAAVTTRREIAETLTQRLHFNTFGGNPVSMAQGLAVMDVIEEDGLQANARAVGGHCIEGMQRLMSKHTLIGDVRGKGLMLGMELGRDRRTKEPAIEEAVVVLEKARDRGLLIGKTGLFGNVLRIKPPLCITKDDIDFALDVLDEVLGGV
ncbi:MAG: aspartate aminotransferase family protein [Candidatus Latescibacteria bacterium]|nr:aspartate aminotransferase family protein [Candidatus Latescibacterota bacterium]